MMEGTNKSEKAAMEFKKGVLLLADVIDYTSQANRLGDKKTAAFNEHLEKKVRKLTKIHKGVFIKRIGDAALIFFDDEKPCSPAPLIPPSNSGISGPANASKPSPCCGYR